MKEGIYLQEFDLVEPFDRLAGRFSSQTLPFFLDSGMLMGGLGRYSFIGCDPFLTVKAKGRALCISRGGNEERINCDPLQFLQRALEENSVPQESYPVPFIGGAVGYLAYDLGRLIERLPAGPPDDLNLPDMALCFYDVVIAYDHLERRAFIISTGLPEAPGANRQTRARERMESARDFLEQSSPVSFAAETDLELGLLPHSNFTKEGYLQAVARAKDYIASGDVYQVNLSQRFQAPCDTSAWALYERLRGINPAPFAAFQDFGDFAVISASPERFLCVRGDTMETRPVKGTRPRGVTPSDDARLAAALLASEKDGAEHIMIVDLERSDLGRVASIGSVSVDDLAALECHPTVYHLTSTIRAQKSPGKGIADVLRATFPGGSITGAPKIRAMEIIDELEPTRRGVYTGAVGYFSVSGNVDLSIAIRTIVLKGGEAYFQVGGGVVNDSEPEEEYQETLDKGRALVQALQRPDVRPLERFAARMSI